MGADEGRTYSLTWYDDEQVFYAAHHRIGGRLMSFTPVRVEPSREVAIKLSRMIRGWLTPREAGALFDLGHGCPAAAVEIGSFMGKSTVCIGWGVKMSRSGKLWSVDPHSGSPEHKGYLRRSMGTYPSFRNNVHRAGLADVVMPLVMRSAQAVSQFEDGTVGFVFVDGDHDRTGEDIDLWTPKLVPGGAIAVHDSIGHEGQWAGVKEACDQRFNVSPLWQVAEVDTLRIAIKEKRK